MTGSQKVVSVFVFISLVLAAMKLGGYPLTWTMVSIPVIAPVVATTLVIFLGIVVVILSSLFHK